MIGDDPFPPAGLVHANVGSSIIGRRLDSGHECAWNAVDHPTHLASICKEKDQRDLEDADALCH